MSRSYKKYIHARRIDWERTPGLWYRDIRKNLTAKEEGVKVRCRSDVSYLHLYGNSYKYINNSFQHFRVMDDMFLTGYPDADIIRVLQKSFQFTAQQAEVVYRNFKISAKRRYQMYGQMRQDPGNSTRAIYQWLIAERRRQDNDVWN